MKAEGRTVVISGISKGIGRAIAMGFAREGFAIAGFSRHTGDLETLAAELENITDIPPFLRSADSSDRQSVQAYATEVIDHFGSVNVLVNNAGFFVPGAITEEEEGVLESTMRTNVYGTYHLTRAILPAMPKDRKSHIFNICSTASIKAYPNGGSYCISKFAMLGFSKVLREEFKEKDIRVTAIMPGPVFTSSWEGAGISEERFMMPEDIADVVVNTYRLPANAVVEELVIRPQEGDI